MKEISISLIIPTHQLGLHLRKCLQSVIDFGKDIKEVIVVFDGITYNPKQFELPPVPHLSILELAKNQGPSYARNYGARQASGNILLFLDSDVLLLTDTIQKVKNHFEQPDTSEALIGSYDNAPTEKDLISKHRNLLHHFTHQTAHGQTSSFWGACGAIRKEIFELSGGFDTSYIQASIEDIELGYRLVDQGYQIRLNKALQIRHLKRWSLLNMIQTDVNQRARPWTKLLLQRKKLGCQELNLSNQERLATLLLLMGLNSLIASFFWEAAILSTIFSFMSLFLIKRKIYHFYTSQFKLVQLPLVIILHWIYLLCAFTGFVLGTYEYLVRINSLNYK
ncbi:glycosyltransferase family 2 protein [Roseivirga sp.]|uniref:glycosyltransferase n=1 Tax=Roseivirga sp. TaxID=1964215 RepID=UPI0023547EA6|nr:glycosyltransferase family 2 protein [Roseivirga sp.]